MSPLVPGSEAKRIQEKEGWDLQPAAAYRADIGSLRALSVDDLSGFTTNANDSLRRLARSQGEHVQAKIDALEQASDEMRTAGPKIAQFNRATNENNRRVELWQRSGIYDQLPHLPLGSQGVGRVVRVLLMLGLAAADTWIFAEAASVVTGAARSLTDVGYVIGGIVGLLVFVGGVLVGRKYKDWALIKAKERTLRRLEDDRGGDFTVEDIDTMRRDVDQAPDFWKHVGYLAILFSGFALVGLAVRLSSTLSGDTDEPLLFTILLGFVPLMVALIEFYAYHPSVVLFGMQEPKKEKQVLKAHRVAEDAALGARVSAQRELALQHAKQGDLIAQRIDSWDAAGMDLESAIVRLNVEGVSWAEIPGGTPTPLVQLPELLAELPEVPEELCDDHVGET